MTAGTTQASGSPTHSADLSADLSGLAMAFWTLTSLPRQSVGMTGHAWPRRSRRSSAKEPARRSASNGSFHATTGVWLGDGSWLELAAVREVRSMVVGLDDFGPLAVALGDLERAGMLGREACHGSPRCMTLRSSARSSTDLPSS